MSIKAGDVFEIDTRSPDNRATCTRTYRRYANEVKMCVFRWDSSRASEFELPETTIENMPRWRKV